MEDAIRGGYAYIGTEHLLAGILREGNNMAVRILRSPVWMPGNCIQH